MSVECTLPNAAFSQRPEGLERVAKREGGSLGIRRETALGSEMWRLLSTCVAPPLLWSVSVAAFSTLPSCPTGAAMFLSGGICLALTAFLWRGVGWCSAVAALDAVATACFFASLSALPLLNAVVQHELHLVFERFALKLFVGDAFEWKGLFGLTLSLAGYFLSWVTEFNLMPSLDLAPLDVDRSTLAASLCSVLLKSARRGLVHARRVDGGDVVVSTFAAEAFLGGLLCASGVLFRRTRVDGCRYDAAFFWSLLDDAAFWIFVAATFLWRLGSSRSSQDDTRRHSCRSLFDSYAILWTALWCLLFPAESVNGAALTAGVLLVAGIAVMSIRQATFLEDNGGAYDPSFWLLDTADVFQTPSTT